jgi:hypothetical protein
MVTLGITPPRSSQSFQTPLSNRDQAGNYKLQPRQASNKQLEHGSNTDAKTFTEKTRSVAARTPGRAQSNQV